jgi:hypothetical protein
MNDHQNKSAEGQVGDPLSRGNLICKVFNSINTLEVIRQRLLLADEKALSDEEPLGIATVIATVIEEINNAITEEAEEGRTQ